MIFVTGDTHGDFTRFATGNFPEQKEMTKDDFMIICGDFGGVWDGSKTERYWLDWLESKPFTTLFVSGNHENYDMLARLPVEQWNGGKVQRVRPSILHLMRGQVFSFGGRRVFTMGGASSHDISGGILEPDDPNFQKKKKRLDRARTPYRINHKSWWEQELPSAEEYAEAERNLNGCGRQVDWIFSHCCPASIQEEISDGAYASDHLLQYFEELKENCRFSYWFFGHYHSNRIIREKYVLLYEQVIPLH